MITCLRNDEKFNWQLSYHVHIIKFSHESVAILSFAYLTSKSWELAIASGRLWGKVTISEKVQLLAALDGTHL